MAWIESHTTMRNHKKLIEFCQELGINRAQAIGHLHMLWWWAIENREDGDLTGLFDKDIAIACDWDGDSKRLIEALNTSKWLQNGFIVDWDDYSWRLLHMRKSNRERQKRFRNALHNQLCLPLVTGATIPNHTIQIKDMFKRFYEKYPKKQGKTDAEKAFVKLAPNDALLETILTALAAQLQTEAWTKDDGKYVPLPATWLRGHRWEDEIGVKVNGTKPKPFPKDA